MHDAVCEVFHNAEKDEFWGILWQTGVRSSAPRYITGTRGHARDVVADANHAANKLEWQINEVIDTVETHSPEGMVEVEAVGTKTKGQLLRLHDKLNTAYFAIDRAVEGLRDRG